MRRALLTIAALLGVLVLPRGGLAADRFILRASPDVIEQVCADHNLRVVRYVGRRHLALVEPRAAADASDLAGALQTDSRVYDFEAARPRRVLNDSPGLAESSVRPGSVDRTPADYFGATAWTGYVQQPAALRVGADLTRAAGATGRGVVVAVIDSGIDPSHPALAGSVLEGYDFTRDAEGASEWGDLSATQSGGLIGAQSGGLIGAQSGGLIGAQSGGLIGAQSGGLIGAQVGDVPPGFGHGTVVSGLVRLIAPEARILPLKVLSADGTGATEDLIEAIYLAVDRGAKVINMSLVSDSREVKRAIQYATNRGVICVASAGNDGKRTLVFPAALYRVLGVASTTLDDVRASFSNYGARLVSVAAPGEGVISTYPGGGYAIVSGTSFSTAIVSGAAAILAGAQPGMDYADAMDAFHYSLFLGRDLGFGRIDIPSALSAVQAQVWLKPKRGWTPAAEEDES
jgi:subtilisin family serine protease